MTGYQLVLAVRPFTRGLAFSLFEGPASPVDWGVKDIRGSDKTGRILSAARELIGRHEPEVLVIERCSMRRSRNAHQISRAILRHAEAQSIETSIIHRKQIRACFSEAKAVSR